jgi:hypothetical protein
LAPFDRQRDPRLDEKPDRLDIATGDAMDADFSDRRARMQLAREPFRRVDQIEELRRILSEQSGLRAKGAYPSGKVAYGRTPTVLSQPLLGPQSAVIGAQWLVQGEC